jgi:ACT domain-containing protein
MTKTNIIVVVLTILSYWSILSIARRKTKKSFSMVIGSQTDVHNLTKVFFEKNTTKQKTSQMQQYEEKNRIDVLVIGDKAYWISNNVFYTGDIVDGQIDHDTAKPIETHNMEKEEIDKMLFIIDSLKNGNKNDFGGTRH